MPATCFEHVSVNLAKVMTATTDKHDDSSPELQQPYLKSRFETFEMKILFILDVCSAYHARISSLPSNLRKHAEACKHRFHSRETF